MKRWLFIDLGIFLLMGILALTFSPDTFSLIIICTMILIIAVTFGKGMWMVFDIAEGFRTGVKYIGVVQDVTTASKWDTFVQVNQIFRNKILDKLFEDYRERVEAESMKELTCSDIEYVINEEVLSLATYRSIVLQIPGSLTALGLIGTFLGLILGISGIAFSSLDAAISSITMLLSGIETAFYTSIIGVIFSLIFNLSHKFAWNVLLREMGVFMNEFHKHILPEEENQRKILEKEERRHILECLERIPKGGEYMGPVISGQAGSSGDANENALMTEIYAAQKNGRFLFYVQPRVDLTSGEIRGGEALMRWEHETLGVISPAVFLPILEKNGYIVKLDCYMWEAVCRQIRAALDKGIRPLPVSVNVSKMDILVMDVAEFFEAMVKKYQIPPQYIQLEIAENAYAQSSEVAKATEEKLRQTGFYVIINGAKGEYDTLSLFGITKADALRLDMAVLEKIRREDPEALQSIVEQARKARVKLLASGIENARQLTGMRRIGFAEGQGFFLYKPMCAEEFEELVKNRK